MYLRKEKVKNPGPAISVFEITELLSSKASIISELLPLDFF